MRRLAAIVALLVVVVASLLPAARAFASPDDGDDFDSPSSGGGSSDDEDESSGGASGGGGYDSSSGDGGNSGSGSTSGYGPIVTVGLFFVGMFGVRVALVHIRTHRKEWSAGAISTEPMRVELEALQAEDPDFSLVALEDFLYALYAAANRARGNGTIDAYTTHLGTPTRALYQRPRDLTEVRTVVIGAMRIVGLTLEDSVVDLHVTFVSNYTEVRAGIAASFAVRETWLLQRRRGTLSPTPSPARIERCPSCGSPRDVVREGRCAHCGKVVDRGDFDWTVASATIEAKEPRSPQLTGRTRDRDPSRHPTIFDPHAEARFAALTARDPSCTRPRLVARLGEVFVGVQMGWSTREPRLLRPVTSDALFHKLVAQVETYRALGIRNLLDGARIARVELARVTSDRWFDAVTMRVFVLGKDYRVREADGSLVSGDPRQEHPYAEYWTLIRGTAARGTAHGDRACPACGAPLAINMAGSCEHCAAHVTSGEFDWVLSRIEQDTVYRG